MNTSKEQCEAAKLAKAAAVAADERELTMEQRGWLIIAACELAAELERSKIASGLPPSQPAPWPKSTWDFLKRSAARVRGE